MTGLQCPQNPTLDLRLRAALEGFHAAYAIASPQMYGAALFPEEAMAVARAVPARRREFAAGRAAARAALAQLGQGAVALPPDPDRVPLWPPGMTGSISHCERACCAIAAPCSQVLGIGIDLEHAGNLDEGVRRLVLGSTEALRLAALPISAKIDAAMIAFSAKEAFYKALFPLTRRFLSFLDVELTFAQASEGEGTFAVHSVDGGLPEALLKHPFYGRWSLADGVVLSVAAVLQAGQTKPQG